MVARRATAPCEPTPTRRPWSISLTPRAPEVMNRRAHLLWILAFAPLLAASLPDAHDDLRSATPGEGDTLQVVPDTLRLTFTRAQNLELASVTLTGPGGEVALGRMRADPDSAARVLVPVEGPWAAGVHTVHWRIVGQDGHPVSGTYRFVVADSAEGLPTALPDSLAEGPAGGQESPAERAPEADAGATGESAGGGFGVDSPLYVAVRWLGFAGLLGVLGAAAYGLVVLPLARRRAPEVDVAHGRRAAAAPGMVAAGLLVLATIGRLWAQKEALAGPGDPWGALLGTLLTSTVWGTGWMLQMGAAVLALVAFVAARRSRGAVPWAVAGGATLVLAFTRGLSGHAVAVEHLTTLAVLADGVHVLAAGGWMGGLLMVLLVAVPTVRGGEAPRALLAPIVHAFSLTALVFAALLVVTGVFASWLHLGEPGALWGSAYGRTLLLKLALLVPLLGTGAWNWLRVRPALARGEPAARHLRRSGGAELALAVGILLVTAVLVATPPPMDQGPERGAASAPVAPAGVSGAATSP